MTVSTPRPQRVLTWDLPIYRCPLPECVAKLLWQPEQGHELGYTRPRNAVQSGKIDSVVRHPAVEGVLTGLCEVQEIDRT